MSLKKEKKLSKNQLYGLRSYRSAMVRVIFIIMFLSLWFKVLSPLWTFNDVVVEIVTMFLIMMMGMLANIRNNFPIFQSRRFRVNKNFAYSVTAFFSLLFLFIVYQNIVDPEFISYVAGLSFHDLFTVIVNLIPLFLLLIYVIYFSFQCMGGKKNFKKSKFLVYDSDTERSLNRYKVMTVKIIFVLMLLSIWAKVGLHIHVSFFACSTEILTVFAIMTLFIVGNIDNKLEPFHNFQFPIDKYFFISFLLPYFFLVIYFVFSSDFRMAISRVSFYHFLSLLVYISPLFLVSSLLFYLGGCHPEVLQERRKALFRKKSKSKFNSMLSLVITLLLLVIFLYYAFHSILITYTFENVLQTLLVFLPLTLIIYLVIYSGVSEINR